MTVLTKTVTLNPGRSQGVAFAVTPSEPGNYTVRVNGLQGEFSVQQPPVPPIDYSGDRGWCAYRIYHYLSDPQAATWVVNEVEGRIGNLSVEFTKAGMAGMEATFEVITGEKTIAVEVLGWWQWGHLLTGVVIYDYNYTPERSIGKKVEIDAWEMLHYRVSVIPGGVLTNIWNLAGELIFEYLYECNAQKIIMFQTELEYWRYYEEIDGQEIPRVGQFSFTGEVTLERLYLKGVGWKNVADVTKYFLDIAGRDIADPRALLNYDHSKQEGSWVFKGEVIDNI